MKVEEWRVHALLPSNPNVVGFLQCRDTVAVGILQWTCYINQKECRAHALLPSNPQCSRIPTIGDQHVARILLQYAPWQGC